MYPNFPTGGQRCIIKQLQHILKHTIPKGCIPLCQGRNGYIDSMRSIFRNHKRWVSIHSGQSGQLKYRTRVPTFDKEMMTIMEIAQPDVMRGSRSIRPTRILILMKSSTSVPGFPLTGISSAHFHQYKTRNGVFGPTTPFRKAS